MEAWDTGCGRSLEVEEFKEDVAMPIEGFADALVRRYIKEGREEGFREKFKEEFIEGREEGRREATIEVIWNLHELDFTDEKISKAVDQPIEYVQEVLKKERPSQEAE